MKVNPFYKLGLLFLIFCILNSTVFGMRSGIMPIFVGVLAGQVIWAIITSIYTEATRRDSHDIAMRVFAAVEDSGCVTWTTMPDGEELFSLKSGVTLVIPKQIIPKDDFESLCDRIIKVIEIEAGRI